MVTTLVKGGGILTMDATATQIPSGFVLVEGTRIAAIGPMSDAPADGDVDEVIDATNGWVTPGFINMHQHHWYHLLKGMSEGLYLEDWVTQVLLPAAEALRQDDYLASMRLAAADMLLTGTTSFFNHSVTEVDAPLVARLAETSRRTGIRQFFGKELRAKTSLPSREHRAQVEDLLTRYPHGVDDRFSVHLAIESGEHWLQVGAMDGDLANYAAQLVRRFNITVSDHVTGGTLFRSVTDFRRREGCGEVQWLAKHGLLTNRTLLAHAVVDRRKRNQGGSGVWLLRRYLPVEWGIHRRRDGPVAILHGRGAEYGTRHGRADGERLRRYVGPDEGSLSAVQFEVSDPRCRRYESAMGHGDPQRRSRARSWRAVG